MIATPEELAIHCAHDFERLPEEGLWEVADGRAILLPGNELDHQEISIGLVQRILADLMRRGSGFVLPAVNVDIPPGRGEPFRTRVPDLVVYERRPEGKRFYAVNPPEIAVEVLATPRGNVERTEKMDDYAAAGIAEYWIVNPFDRVIEIYHLFDGAFKLAEMASERIDSAAMPGLRVDLRGLWRKA